MIDSNIIEWLDFNDSIKNVDIYSRKKLVIFFELLRTLQINNYFPLPIIILFILIYFIQIWIISPMFISFEVNIFLEILNYLKKVTILDIITKYNFVLLFIILFVVIIFDIK